VSLVPEDGWPGKQWVFTGTIDTHTLVSCSFTWSMKSEAELDCCAHPGTATTAERKRLRQEDQEAARARDRGVPSKGRTRRGRRKKEALARRREEAEGPRSRAFATSGPLAPERDASHGQPVQNPATVFNRT
jgi:hypothetical protein